MKTLLKKTSLSMAFIIAICIFIYPHLPEIVYEYAQKAKFEYMPRFSQSAVKEMESNIYKKAIEDSQEAFFPIIKQNELNLTLDLITDNEEFKIDTKSYKLLKYKANFLTLVKRVPELGPSYIGSHNEDLFIVQENGLIFSIKTKDLLSGHSTISANLHQSNIFQFGTYFDFYGQGQFGIKDILIDQGFMYLSYIREIQPDCFNTSVLKAKIQNFLQFSILFSPDECVERKSPDFNAHISGGRLVKFKEQKLLLSIGTYKVIKKIKNNNLDFNRQKPLSYSAQIKSSKLGKILSIDSESGESQIISIGHRNPQGLYYSQKHDDIFSTEHGPNGGDEINYNKYPDLSEIENYGWPISSYGGHYGVSSYKRIADKLQIVEERDEWPYAVEPLYKKHKKYGFIEPLLNFAPSVGISQIVEVNKNFLNNGAYRNFAFGTMGYATTEFIPSLSIFLISINKENIITSENQLVINERIRDLIFNAQNNIIIFSSDSNAVIGSLRET